MTNAANYQRGKIHHRPWHSDIPTSNQLNTPPGRLSRSFQTTNSKQWRSGANQTLWIFSKQTCPINLLLNGIPDAISNSNSNTIRTTISERTKASSEAIPDSNPKTISKSNPDHSLCNTLLQEGGLHQWLCETVGKYLSSQYIVQVDLSISRHICSKIVLGCNVCNCGSVVDSVLGDCDQWLWMREHMRDSQDAELDHEMQDLYEFYAAYSEGIVFGIGRGLGSRLLFSRSPVDRSSEGDDQSTHQFVLIRASSIVRIYITLKCAFSCSSECSVSKCSSECSFEKQSPVLQAIEVPKQGLQSYHMVIPRVLIVPAENSNGLCNIGPSGCHRVNKESDHQLVYGGIAGFFVGLSLGKLHSH